MSKKQKKNKFIKKEIISIGLIALSILMLISVFKNDSAGVVGIFISTVLKGLFGIGAYILPFVIIGICVYIVAFYKKPVPTVKIIAAIGFFIVIISFINTITIKDTIYNGALDFIKYNYINGSLQNGGLIGGSISYFFVNTFGKVFSYVLFVALMIISTIIITEKSFFTGVSKSYTVVKDKIDEVSEDIEHYQIERENKREVKRQKNMDFVIDEDKKNTKDNRKILLSGEKGETAFDEDSDIKFRGMDFTMREKEEGSDKNIENNEQIEEIFKEEDFQTIEENDEVVEIKINQSNKPKREISKPIEKVKEKPKEKIVEKTKEEVEAENIEKEISENSGIVDYEFPPIDILQIGEDNDNGDTRETILKNSKKLEDTLKSFGVEAKVIEVSRGPTVTRYELSPGPGVKVSRISNLSDDLALNLAASGIRIEAPIPGKAAVGIEVPNKETNLVYLREVIEDPVFKNFESKLAFGLGKDIAGNVRVADISKMPHLLIAGATGSGKSVCINTLIASIIYKANPEEVKLIMIDPKVVELSVYTGIPHLLIPVVTDPKKASGALNWAVQEMLRRYELFAENSVRDLKGYNEMAKSTGEVKKEPQIVIIIDELSDLMMAVPKEVEDSICRLAQMARAAGIHLIIATQRPSVDVITGLIKANIPSRLAFAVSSGTDSRTILDMVGAEKLLGKGDMLFYPTGASKPVRIQGAFISDKEVERLVKFLTKDKEHIYDDELIETVTGTGQIIEIDDDLDEYFEDAVDFIIEKESASASMLQRQFRIGYNRAARIVEDIEARNFISPADGSRARDVYINMSEWEDIKSGVPLEEAMEEETDNIEEIEIEETVEKDLE